MKSKNVLVVDDDDAILKLFEIVGKKLGLNIVTAENGVQGLKAFSFYDFFMAITDLNMPKMDGVEFIEAVRKIPKYRTFPFLIISGNINDFDSRVAFLEQVDIREKPIKKETIEKIFQQKLLQIDEDAKTIHEEDLIKKIVEGLKGPCDLLLTIVTKDKATIEELKSVKDIQFLSNNFFLSYPAFIGGNKITFLFSFDLPVAKAIKWGVVPKEDPDINIETEIILGSLRKALSPLLIKVYEAIGHSLEYSLMRNPVVVGSGDTPITYTFDFGEPKKALKVSNKYGVFYVYIFHEF